jgi:DNA-binding GntR family transcriptional regulator
MHILASVHNRFRRSEPLPTGSTLTEDVYQRLRADLLACRLMPGQKLKIEELCARLAAGSSAVREALSRLAADGFVVLEPQRGFRVPPLSLAELRDLTIVRCQIESQCLRDAVAHGDLDWETGVIAALHRMSRTPERAADDPKRYSDAYGAAHTAFHQRLVAACRSPWLLRIREQLYAQTERYRWLSKPLAVVERDLDAEHGGIAEAAIARRAEEAVERLTAHLQLTADILLTSPLLQEISADGAPTSSARQQAVAAVS